MSFIVSLCVVLICAGLSGVLITLSISIEKHLNQKLFNHLIVSFGLMTVIGALIMLVISVFNVIKWNF
jgi:hypothetical protein